MDQVTFRAAEHLFSGEFHRKVIQGHVGTATESAHQANGKPLAVAPTTGGNGMLQAVSDGRIHLKKQHRLFLTAEKESHVGNTVHVEKDAPGSRGNFSSTRHTNVGLHQMVHHHGHVGEMVVGDFLAEQVMKQHGQLHHIIVILLSHDRTAEGDHSTVITASRLPLPLQTGQSRFTRSPISSSPQNHRLPLQQLHT